MVNHPLHRLFVPLFYPFTYHSLIWLNNSFQASLQNDLIKYKILSFDGTFATNSSNTIYNYSNDEDLKDAEIIGVSPLHIGLYSAITWINITVNTTAKNIYLLVGTGQRVGGTYSILYK